MKPTWRSNDGRIRLYRADCRDVLRSLPDGYIDTVITDPPYGVDLKQRVTKKSKRTASKNYNDGEEWVKKEIIPRLKEWIDATRRAAVTPGTRMLQNYPIATDIGCIFTMAGQGMGKWGFSCFYPVLFYGACPFLENKMGCRPNSMLASMPAKHKIDHPCPKPIKFMQWMMERASAEFDRVADPFMGSGTGGIAAVRLKRKFIGIEIDPHYFDIAVSRIEKAIRDQHGSFDIRTSMIRKGKS